MPSTLLSAELPRGGGVFYMLQVKRDLLKRKMIQGIQAERLRMRF